MVAASPRPVAAWSPSDDRRAPYIERRIGHTRLSGSLGLHHAVGATIDPHEVNNAAATRLGGSDSTLGARLSLKF